MTQSPEPVLEKKFVVQNKLGLHARPAALFVRTANHFKSDITIQKGKQKVNGKSIMGILMLGAQNKSKITLIADGEDALEALTELEEFLKKNE